MAELELIPLLALERTFFFGVGASNHDTRKLCASHLNPHLFLRNARPPTLRTPRS